MISLNALGRQHILGVYDSHLVSCPLHLSSARLPPLAFAQLSGSRAAGVLALLLSQALSWCAPFFVAPWGPCVETCMFFVCPRRFFIFLFLLRVHRPLTHSKQYTHFRPYCRFELCVQSCCSCGKYIVFRSCVGPRPL